MFNFFFSLLALNFFGQQINALKCYQGQMNTASELISKPSECPSSSYSCLVTTDLSQGIVTRACSATNCTAGGYTTMNPLSCINSTGYPPLTYCCCYGDGCNWFTNFTNNPMQSWPNNNSTVLDVAPNCTGVWGNWSDWSECPSEKSPIFMQLTAINLRFRSRQCLAWPTGCNHNGPIMCNGNHWEQSSCTGTLPMMPSIINQNWTQNSTNAPVQYAPPIVIRAVGKHSASLIFLHGLGDQGNGWASVFRNEFPLSYMKYIFPNAPSRPVTLAFGMRMPAWFDILGLDPSSPEDELGIEQAKNYVHGLIEEEIASGVPSNRIALGGFSMGGTLALYAGLTYDGTLGGIISMSSFLLQRNKIPGNHKANLKTPIFLGHGRDDLIVPYTIGQMTDQTLKQFNPNVKFHTYSFQHVSTPQEHKDVLEFIKTYIPSEDPATSHSANRTIQTLMNRNLMPKIYVFFPLDLIGCYSPQTTPPLDCIILN